MSLKTQFLVSILPEFRLSGKYQYECIDDFVLKSWKTKNDNSLYFKTKNIRKSDKDLQVQAQNFIGIYQKILPIISKTLNKVHQTEYSIQFWATAMGGNFLKIISIAYDFFLNLKINYDCSHHLTTQLAEESYYYPESMDDAVNFLWHHPLGNEQLFGIYHKVFRKSSEVIIDTSYEPFDNKVEEFSNTCSDVKSEYDFSRYCNIFSLVRKLFNKKKAQLGVFGAYFSVENYNKLVLSTLGKINEININIPNFSRDVNFELRDKFCNEFYAENDVSENDFEFFLFKVFKSLFPISLLENFKNFRNFYLLELKKFPNLKHIISEGWLSSEHNCLVLAFAKENNIKHINNEHNGLFFPWAYNPLVLYKNIPDITFTTGWDPGKLVKVKKGASLYPWKYKIRNRKIHDIIIVNGPMNAKVGFIGMGYSAEGSVESINFAKRFFQELSEDTLQKIYFRDYPLHVKKSYMLFNDLAEYKPFIKKMKLYDSSKRRARKLMSKSRIVIFFYIASGYIEALLMNIPCLIFWPPMNYILRPEYADLFDEMEEVGIVQKDPQAAAEFLEGQLSSIEQWWNSSDTQKAKNKFLEKIIGDPNNMLEILKAYVV